MHENNGFIHPQTIRYEIITDIEDVRECMHLRYISYRYVNFIESNLDRLDIDPYDRYSTFLGAYNVTDGNRKMIGTLRLISDREKGQTCSQVEELIESAIDPKIKKTGRRPKRFPIMESFSLPEPLTEHLCQARANGVNPYEISRLTIRPDYWMHGIDIGLHHLLILESWMREPHLNDYLIAVHPRSRKRYERIGFKQIPGTDEVLYRHIDQLAIAMVIDLAEYLDKPRSYKAVCEALFPGYKENGFFERKFKDRRNRGKPPVKQDRARHLRP